MIIKYLFYPLNRKKYELYSLRISFKIAKLTKSRVETYIRCLYLLSFKNIIMLNIKYT